MPFKPGQSGNPGGRAKAVLADGRSLQDLAREHTEDALTVLIGVMNDDKATPRARVGAASEILDRGWGRPKQDVDGTFTVKRDAAHVSDDELVAVITGAAAK